MFNNSGLSQRVDTDRNYVWYNNPPLHCGTEDANVSFTEPTLSLEVSRNASVGFQKFLEYSNWDFFSGILQSQVLNTPPQSAMLSD